MQEFFADIDLVKNHINGIIHYQYYYHQYYYHQSILLSSINIIIIIN